MSMTFHQLRQAQQQGAMNSLYDPELAEKFSATFRLDSLARMEIDLVRGKKFTGNTLYEAIYKKLTALDDNIRYPDVAGGCFPKGTPVTVKGGWKPIEEIKVGDYVLSSPEDGSGKPEYKRVVKTTKHEKKTIRKIGFGWNPTKMSLSTMAATGNHPFWVEGVGWTRADLLKEGDLLRKVDGNLTKVEFQYPIYQFHNPSTGEPEPGTGWVQMVEELDMMLNPASGLLFDYENHRFFPKGENIGELDWDDMTEENHLEVTVYNLEVEDFHTYYVGGIWVHNINCTGVSGHDPKWRKQTKHCRLPFPRPRSCGGESGPAGPGEGAARRVVRVFRKVTGARCAAWNDVLCAAAPRLASPDQLSAVLPPSAPARPCRATLPRQAWEGTASGCASSGKGFLHLGLHLESWRRS